MAGRNCPTCGASPSTQKRKIVGLREEIIRCRDCEKSRESGWKCSRFTEEIYNEDQEIGELVMANVKPNGFCFLAKRRES